MSAMTRPRTALTIAFAVTMLAATAKSAYAGDEVWKRELVRDGIEISSRAWPGSSYKEIRAIGEIDAPPERVLAVLDDLLHYPEFMPPTTAARLLSRDETSSYYYMEITPPVISRRDYCIHVSMQRIEGDKLRSYWVADNSACLPERKGIVRVHHNEGEWILAPIDGGRRSYVVYRCHIEVGGAVPAWMVNSASVRELPNVFGAVRRVVSQPRYASCTAGPCKKS
jgi:hypothetical protein